MSPSDIEIDPDSDSDPDKNAGKAIAAGLLIPLQAIQSGAEAWTPMSLDFGPNTPA